MDIYKYIVHHLLPQARDISKEFPSNIVVPVTLQSLNPCRMLWNFMESSKCWSIMTEITFQRTSTRKITWFFPLHLGIGTTVSHVNSVTNYPATNTICIISTTIFHLERLGFYSARVTTSQIFRISTCIPNGPLERSR